MYQVEVRCCVPQMEIADNISPIKSMFVLMHPEAKEKIKRQNQWINQSFVP